MSTSNLPLLVLLLAPALAPLQSVAQNTDAPPLLVEELQCRGNESTSCAYILSHLYLSVGSPVDEEEVRNARFRLSALPNFASVRIFLEKGSERGKANVIVEVVEASPRAAGALLGLANHGSSVLGARLGHQNLLGSGERLDFSAIARFPHDGLLKHETQSARLQYLDPNLFASSRYFLIAGASYLDDEIQTGYGDRVRNEQTSIDLSVGRRLWDFSYLALGYKYLPTGRGRSTIVKRNGEIEIEDASFSHAVFLDYGWNSEDDAYFPTQGGRFHAGLAVGWLDTLISTDPENNGDPGITLSLALGYRHTWRFAGNNFWTLKLGVVPGIESAASLDTSDGLFLGYARSLPTDGLFSAVQRGRWYVDAGVSSYGLSGGHVVRQGGLKAGLRLDTKSFGLVELYLFAVQEW